MTSKLTPSNPSEVMVIRRVTPNITTLSTPFWRFGKVKIGGRGTLVRLQNGSVAVFSPTALTPEVKETVKSLGTVKYIAALDMEHHMFIGPWHQQYPDAKVIGPEGLLEKRDKQGNEKVPFSVIFKDSEKEKTRVGPEFDAEFDYEYVPSHANKEIVFNYKPDKTLIEGDLLFNLPATEQFSKAGESAETGLPTKLANYIQSTTGPATAQARFVYYALSSKDRTGFGRSISRIENWDFDRIIPCHGDVIETGGKGIFQKVMQLMPRPGTTAPTATTS